MNCGSCTFWAGDRSAAPTEAEPVKGLCVRYPPQAGGVVMMQGLQGPRPVIVWGAPETASIQTCGEYKPALVTS